MNEIRLTQTTDDYFDWTLYAANGRVLAESGDYYNTKFHCEVMARKLFPSARFVDKTIDKRRKRA